MTRAWNILQEISEGIIEGLSSAPILMWLSGFGMGWVIWG